MFCSILIVNHMCSITNTNANLTLLVIPCYFLGEVWIFNIAITVTYYVDFHPNFKNPRQDFITKITKLRFNNWHDLIQILVIHDNSCKLIHKKCHYRIYHSDKKCPMKIFTLVSVVLHFLWTSSMFLATLTQWSLLGLATHAFKRGKWILFICHIYLWDPPSFVVHPLPEKLNGRLSPILFKGRHRKVIHKNHALLALLRSKHPRLPLEEFPVDYALCLVCARLRGEVEENRLPPTYIHTNIHKFCTKYLKWTTHTKPHVNSWRHSKRKLY